MKTPIHHNFRKYFFLPPILGCLYGLAASAQVVVTPVVASVVTANVKPIVRTNVRARVKPYVRPLVTTSVDPVVVANIAPVITPIVSPVFNVDVNPDINVNIIGIDQNEGSWFASIKGDKIRIEFKGDDENHNWSSSSDFMLSEFPSLPRGQKGDFSLKREAGTMTFNGKFDDDLGYGHYKFVADKEFNDYIKSQGVTGDDNRNAFAFFMVNLKRSYIEMLVR
ncbi:MAG: hypothetical protein M3N14_11350, partial [Bacteroidota bacterium]|nr:hypothetical protein [Bacteroidota bacterium]